MGSPQGGMALWNYNYRVELSGTIGSAGICYLLCWSSDQSVGMEH